MSPKNVTKVVWYIPVQLSSLTTQGLWFQVSVFRCQLNSPKLKAEGSKVDGQGSYKAGKLDGSEASNLLAFQPFSLEPSALSPIA
jgi:hypothetical protein